MRHAYAVASVLAVAALAGCTAAKDLQYAGVLASATFNAGWNEEKAKSAIESMGYTVARASSAGVDALPANGTIVSIVVPATGAWAMKVAFPHDAEAATTKDKVASRASEAWNSDVKDRFHAVVLSFENKTGWRHVSATWEPIATKAK